MMKEKVITCPKCKAASFRLTLKIYDNKRNEMVMGCVACGHAMLMKVGDKK
tara:strand:- start:249 stop:401 length:153 start_codon:yes stop_codon:yes gene_type:complete